MKVRRVYLRLNPEKPTDCRIIDYLERSGVSNGKAITAAVLDYLDRQEESRESKAFLQEVKDTIRECLQTLPTAELNGRAQTTAVENDDDEISPLDFIDAMTGGCNFSL